MAYDDGIGNQSRNRLQRGVRYPNRQVIFVGGTSYSGSTLIDMMLTHGPGGFSCGEVAAVFRPYRKKHIHYQPHAGPAVQIPWDYLIATGPDAFYAAIFDEDPNVRRIIDSSKDPQWISTRRAALEAQGIATRNVLIWKTPAEFFQSRKKRGRQYNWERAWINYHRYYFRQVTGFAALSYKKLVTEPEALANLCRYLEIPYFSGKHEYWRGDYQTLFGNSSAKIHLSDMDSHDNDGQGLAAPDDIDDVKSQAEQHREIYYEAPDLTTDAVIGPKCDPYLRFLCEAENRLMSNLAAAPEPPTELRANQVSIGLRRIKRRAITSIVRRITPTVKHTYGASRSKAKRS